MPTPARGLSLSISRAWASGHGHKGAVEGWNNNAHGAPRKGPICLIGSPANPHGPNGRPRHDAPGAMLAAPKRPPRVQASPSSAGQPSANLPIRLTHSVMNPNTNRPATERLPGFDRKTRRWEWITFLLLAKLALAAVILAVVHPFDFAGGKHGVFAALSTGSMAPAGESSSQHAHAALGQTLAVKSGSAAVGSQPNCCVTPDSPCA